MEILTGGNIPKQSDPVAIRQLDPLATPMQADIFTESTLSQQSTSNQQATPTKSQEQWNEISALDLLLQTFVSKDTSAKQVREVYLLSGENSKTSTVCLLSGPTLSALLKMVNDRFDELPRHRVRVDAEDVWSDVVACYKRTSFRYLTHLQVHVEGQPAIDTGGVRRQIYTTVLHQFASNKYIKLFDGPDHHLRPMCSAEARSSGLLKVLGGIVAHSICQDGVGFPHLSPTCFWYIVAGEEMALQSACMEDLPADASFVLKQVCILKVDYIFELLPLCILSRYKVQRVPRKWQLLTRWTSLCTCSNVVGFLSC